MKWLDLPPVWLAGFAALAWLQASRLPMGLSFGGTCVIVYRMRS